MTYKPQDFGRLIGMDGFSKDLLETHLGLYEGYVKATNALRDDLAEMRTAGKTDGPAFAELNRRFGWEWNGMRLHELYFGHLGGDGKPPAALERRLAKAFGSFKAWKDDVTAMGEMRGIGWVLTVADPATGELINHWVDEHDRGHFGGTTPVLVMDVFEHAFLVDYGTKKADYVAAFFRNLDYHAVESRLG